VMSMPSSPCLLVQNDRWGADALWALQLGGPPYQAFANQTPA
jgi:hypothetical protein